MGKWRHDCSVSAVKFIVVTQDAEIKEATNGAFQPEDETLIFEDWSAALDACDGADLIFVDLLATLDTPHKIAGYEKFAEVKMKHPVAAPVPLVLIAAPTDYELDFLAGFPNFVFAHVRRPVTYKILRRASTWV